MISDKSLLVLSFLGCLVSLLYYARLPAAERSNQSLVVVGVLSRLNNLEQRKAVRATWKRILPEGVVFNFILGDTFCPYHELWRLSEDDCNEWLLEVPSWLKDGESLSLLETGKSQSKRNNKAYRGFSFRVMRFPVVFEGVGILRTALSALCQELNLSSVSIDIRERYSAEVINSITFNITDLSDLNNQKKSGFTFKKFNTKNLPVVDFDGTYMILLGKMRPFIFLYQIGVISMRINDSRNFSFPSKLCNAVYDSTLGRHGLVHINGLLDDKLDTILPFSKYSCPLVSLKYRILDVVSLKRHYGAKATQNSVESQRIRELRRLLDREEEDHSDLVFLPVLDSAFNNSIKLALYSQHIGNNLEFDHLLLTEDTSFVFIKNVLDKLERISSRSLWWSDFEVLPRTGENVLSKSANMVIAQHLVSFIAHNTPLYLKHFSSLVSSLAVWLSATPTKRLQDGSWNMKDCQNLSVFTQADLACSGLSPGDMKTVWNKLRHRHYQ